MAKKKTIVKKKATKKAAKKKSAKKQTTTAAELADLDLGIPPEALLMQAAQVVLDAAPPLEAASDWVLSGAQVATVERWCSTKLVGGMLTEMATRDKHEVITDLFPDYIGRWWEAKQQPPNPKLATALASCQFIVQPTRLSVEMCQGSKTAKEALIAQGLHWRRAQVFAEYVTSDTEDEWVGSLSEMRSHEVAQIQAAADDLYEAVKAHPQWSCLVQPREKHRVVDPATFAQELPIKARSADEMRRVLRVIRPVVYPTNAVHLAATAAVEARRGWEADHRTEFFSPDGQCRVVAQQRLVMVYSRSHGMWYHQTTTQRPSVVAARQFAKQIAGNAIALADVLS